MKQAIRQHLVVCCDLNGLVEKMILAREIDEDNMLIRIGMDGGGWIHENLPFGFQPE